MKKTTYKAQGSVLGYLWSGQLGTGGSKTFTADNIDDLKAQINQAIENNQATGTGDFQSQIGAAMNIDTIREIEIDGRVYCNVESERMSFGDEMTQEQSAELWDAYYFN